MAPKLLPKAAAKGVAKAAPKAAAKAKAKAKVKAKAKAKAAPHPPRPIPVVEGRVVPRQPPLVPFLLWINEHDEAIINERADIHYTAGMIEAICEFFANTDPDTVQRHLGMMLRYRPLLLTQVANRYGTYMDVNRVRTYLRVGETVAVTPSGVVRTRPGR